VELPLPSGGPPLGPTLTRLLAAAAAEDGAGLARALFGLWLCRDCPVAILQLSRAGADGGGLIGQRYELAPGAPPPAWLDPGRGGSATAGLLHSVFLPIGKLIAIGRLLTPADDPPSRNPSLASERTLPVLDLGQKIASLANMAQLARDTRNRRPWQRFLSAAAESADQSDHETDAGPLTEVVGFGSNPGNLRMLAYVPEDLPTGAGLVVVLHGCTQTAHAYDRGTGWSTLADRHGFAVVYPEQRRSNNPLRCFNWFRAEDAARDGGEPESVRQMVERMIADHGLARDRVFVTGLSAGGAMTSVLLATHPELFAGGAILAAVPYGAATGLQEAFDVIFQGKSLPADDWAARVRAASPHQGPWPRIQVWHGAADTTVKPINQAEIAKQWAAVHGLAAEPAVEETTDGHQHRIWRDADGRDVIETYTIAGMGHGAAIDPNGPDGCGRPQPFIVDAGINSTRRIATAWGLTDVTRAVTPRPKPAKAPAAAAQPAAAATPGATPVPIIYLGDETRGDAYGRRREQRWRERTGGGGASAGAGARAGADAGAAAAGGAAAGGLDVLSIITRSFEAAGLIDPESARRRAPSRAPLGIDIPGILATSFEAAGLLKRRRAADGGEPAVRPMKDVTPPAAAAPAAAAEPEAAKPEAAVPEAAVPGAAEPATGGGEAPRRTRSLSEAGMVTAVAAPPPPPAAVGAEDDGWQLVPGDPARPDAGRVLFGHASSGLAGVIGRTAKTVTCRLALGSAPRLSYTRRLDLAADANPFTAAAFTVVVDGIVVDEAQATGMDYREDDWTEQVGLDLAAFAGRTVDVAFVVEANANVPVEVAAKAWVRDIVVGDASVADDAAATPAALAADA
jgi:feruloyl esterase